ncbi:MAG: redoxin domain-containing protein, partial [Bacteroidetes bacterium]|nr:redoxin domain-containing protein [Bacteroidota bacterium]
MKKIHLLTTLSVILGLTAIPLIIYDQILLSCILCTVGFFATVPDTLKYTSKFQIITTFFISIILGIAIEGLRVGFPYLAISVVFSVIALNFRDMVFKNFGYIRFLWFDAVLILIALGCYLAGNFTDPGYPGWMGWVFPGTLLLFCLFIVIDHFQDKKQFLTLTNSDYALDAGKTAPDFSLPDQNEKIVHLSEFKDKRNILLIFVAGDWCPGCHITMRTYEKNREKFMQKDIMVMAIGPDPVGVNRDMVHKLGLEYKILSDDGLKTAKAYGVWMSEYS